MAADAYIRIGTKLVVLMRVYQGAYMVSMVHLTTNFAVFVAVESVFQMDHGQQHLCTW